MRLCLLGSALSAVIGLAGCMAPTAPSQVASLAAATSAPSAAGEPTASGTTATPLPSARASLDLAALAPVDFADEHLTAICDPTASQRIPDAGETVFRCAEALDLGLRVLRAVSSEPIDRLYFERPACKAIPCSEDELSTGRVFAWSDDVSRAVALDVRSATAPAPAAAPDAHWPEAGPFQEPAASRREIAGIPQSLADRTPLPFCGQATQGEPPSVVGCFRSAVLLGRPIELLENAFGTEGGEVLWIYRSDAGGSITRFQRDGDTWTSQVGALQLGADATSWSFEPLTDSTVVP